MNRPRIAIGLPVYNGAKYVSEAIESVLAQTYADLELVISDNASSDATEEICRDFAGRDSRIRYVRQPQNRGAAWNFNHTVELTSSEYFKWLAHDDAIGPHYLAHAIDVLQRQPELALCHSRTGVIDSRGELIGYAGSDDLGAWELQGVSPKLERKRLEKVVSRVPHQRFLGVLLYSIRCYEVFGLMRRAMLRKTGLYHPFIGGEKIFLGELALAGAFYEIPELLSFSRWHADRFSANPSAQAQSVHVDPNLAGRFPLPHQFRSTLGHLHSIARAEVGWQQRAACLFVLARFVFQLKKWRSMVTDYLRGVGQMVRLPETSVTEPGQSSLGRHWRSLDDVYSKGGV